MHKTQIWITQAYSGMQHRERERENEANFPTFYLKLRFTPCFSLQQASGMKFPPIGTKPVYFCVTCSWGILVDFGMFSESWSR